VKYLDSFEIDKKQCFTPFRATKGRLVYPDHYAIKIEFRNIPTMLKKSSKEKVTA